MPLPAGIFLVDWPIVGDSHRYLAAEGTDGHLWSYHIGKESRERAVAAFLSYLADKGPLNPASKYQEAPNDGTAV